MCCALRIVRVWSQTETKFNQKYAPHREGAQRGGCMSLCPERSVEGAYVSRPRHSRQALAPALLLGVVTLALNASTAMAFGERVKEGASNVLSRGKPAGSRIIAPKCSARPDPGGCPFTGPRGNVLFSRCAGPRGRFSHAPTPLGNRVCNAVLSANSLFKELGTNAEAARRKVEAGMRERLGRVQKAALSSKLPDAFAGARHAVQAIGKGLKQYADDPQCGVKGTIGNAKAFFRTKVQNAKTFAELGAKSARALRELTLAVSEAEKAKHAAQALRREYPRNAEVTDAIFVKVASFGGDVQGIANPRTLNYATAGDKPDHGKPPEAGKPPETGQPPASGAPTPPATNSPPAASAKLWPFMLGVGSCVDGMVDLGRAAFNYTMTGSGVFVCPETAGASCVAAGVTTVNGTLKAIKGVVLAVGGCVATVYDWRNNKDAYAVRWHEIVGRGTAAATRVHVLSTASRAAPDQVEASARDLGAGAQPQVKSIDVPDGPVHPAHRFLARHREQGSEAIAHTIWGQPLDRVQQECRHGSHMLEQGRSSDEEGRRAGRRGTEGNRAGRERHAGGRNRSRQLKAGAPAGVARSGQSRAGGLEHHSPAGRQRARKAARHTPRRCLEPGAGGQASLGRNRASGAGGATREPG